MLRIEKLTKKYGNLTAVDNLSFEISGGDIVGFIGPNGAGKTTTIRVVATLLKPTEGTAYVNGVDVVEHPEDVRPLIGYMPDFFGLYEDVKVWEYLDFFASAYRIPRPSRRQATDDVLELTDLTTKRDSYVSELSRGMQQRLCLAKTILHDPMLLLLDEPASGLDPRARIEIRELLKELRRMGKTILISSHILPELADFCNKIAVIEQGKLVICGEVDQIVAQCRGGMVLRICLADRQDEAIEILRGIETVCDTRAEDGALLTKYIGTEGEHYIVLNALVGAGLKVLSFEQERVDLQDVFMRVTRGVVS